MKLGPETIAAIQVYEWVKNNTDLPFIHIANERQTRSAQEGQILKRMGVRKGVADILIPRAVDIYHGTWIELKVGNNKTSKEQEDFLDDMNAEGYLALAIWGSDAAIEFIKTTYEIKISNHSLKST